MQLLTDRRACIAGSLTGPISARARLYSQIKELPPHEVTDRGIWTVAYGLFFGAIMSPVGSLQGNLTGGKYYIYIYIIFLGGSFPR